MYKIWHCACVCAKLLLSCLTLCDPIDLKVAFQAPLSMGFPRQEYWSGLPFPSPRELPDPGIESPSLSVSCIGRWILYQQCHLGSPYSVMLHIKNGYIFLFCTKIHLKYSLKPDGDFEGSLVK